MSLMPKEYSMNNVCLQTNLPEKKIMNIKKGNS